MAFAKSELHKNRGGKKEKKTMRLAIEFWSDSVLAVLMIELVGLGLRMVCIVHTNLDTAV